MNLLKRKSSPPNGRQRLRSNDQQSLGTSYSYHARRSEEQLNIGRQESRPDAKPIETGFKRFRIHQRFGLIILLVAIVAAVVNVLTLSTNARITPLTSNGSNSFLQSQISYQTAAQKLFASSLLNRNKITVDTTHISQQLLRNFPELSNVSITLPFLSHRPIVYIQPAQPALILTTASGSYVLDNRGKALLNTSGMSDINQLNLPQVTDQSGLRVALNHQILSSDNVSFIDMVVAQLSAAHYTVTSMTLPPTAEELDVRLANQPYYIKFNLQTNDARQQAGTFLATINQLQQQHVTPSQYVDVRLDGRAYYQ